jgi:chromosome segregation ATPase
VIEAAMYGLLGFLAASLLGLAVLSAVWKRAVRLTREAVLATTPTSYRETMAARDSLRAEHAVELRRLERELARLKDETTRLRAEAGRMLPAQLAMERAHQARLREDKALEAQLEAERRDAARLKDALSELGARYSALLEKTFETEAPELTGTAGAAALATITSLEAQIATMKRQLDALRGGAAASRMEPEADGSALRRTIAQLEARLLDKEADLISAQADITRLSLHLDMAGEKPEALMSRLDTELQAAEAEKAKLAARAAAQERALSRVRGENLRLRRELASGATLQDLRSELKSVAAAMTGMPPAPRPSAVQAPANAAASQPAQPRKKAAAKPAQPGQLSPAQLAGKIVRASAAAASQQQAAQAAAAQAPATLTSAAQAAPGATAPSAPAPSASGTAAPQNKVVA